MVVSSVSTFMRGRSAARTVTGTDAPVLMRPVPVDRPDTPARSRLGRTTAPASAAFRVSALLAAIPSPRTTGFHLGPLFVHFYGLWYVVAISAGVALTGRRWSAQGGDRDLVVEGALWAVPAGILGARLYHDVTSWNEVPPNWWGWLAFWQGGLGVWGGIAGGALAGVIFLRRRGVNVARFADAIAPGLLVAQAIGRMGNYFNQELFGGPTTLPWAIEIAPSHRPPAYLAYPSFHPTFLYEIVWNLLLACGLIVLGRHRDIRPPGLFALYVAGYSAFRIFEELLRVDPSHHFLGLRVNLFVAAALTLVGAVWFVRTQRPRSRAS